MSTDTQHAPHETQFDAADALLAEVLRTGEGEAPLTAEQRKARIDAHNDHARKMIALFGRTMTQGEWLAVCRELDMSRADIGADENLVLLAFAYVKEKRAHGAASIVTLLELTDRQLLAAHGFVSDPDAEDDDDQGDAA